MTELLPSLQAAEIRRGLVDYLTTTFALADAEPQRALGEFLEDPVEGIFKGPYVRLRLPFRQESADWEQHLDWRPPFAPYRHQAQAYQRLTTKDLGPDKPRPLPTIVTTGTGSGKTEAFLHPILDHVRRARARGERGMKALILYPMNALADDQAGRLTRLLTSDPELANVTAGLYTGDAREGQAGEGRTRVTTDGLITNRSILRDDPPDIMLTNYKMLDQLLLRPADQPLWAKSALSLTYLVLDEFHTYDGAQGTDVAMLLRRLGLALKDHVPAGHPEREMYDERPLGRVTPVATSATLGDGGDSQRMLAFAEQVFGEPFPADAVITETRVDVDELTASTRSTLDETPVRRLSSLVTVTVGELADVGALHRADGDALVAAVVDVLYDRAAVPSGVSDGQLLAAHPDVRAMVEAAGDAVPVDALVEDRLSRTAVAEDAIAARGAIETILAALSHVRLGDRGAVSVEMTMWVREVTRVDRLVSSQPSFRWGDDGQLDPTAELAGRALPAVYCRSCGRSGWGLTLASTGRDLADRDDTIRRDHLMHRGRFRAVLHAPGEAAAHTTGHADDARAEPHAPNLRWLHMGQRTVLTRRPSDDDRDLLEGHVLPVLMLDGESEDVEKRALNDECPSCGKNDSIRFLGSAVATLLSVSLSTLFGDRHLEAQEKRALVFTDSVQDAAHRAGFVDHRSHAMSLRAALRGALTEPTALDVWVDEVLRRAEGDAFARYRLVPASVSRHDRFEPYWRADTWSRVPTRSRTAVRRRLLFDAALEVGLQSTYGRTLEATGSVGVHVAAGPRPGLVAIARQALADDATEMLPGTSADITDQQLARWVRGTVEHLRRDGAIDHEWLKRYVADDGNRIWIWGKRRREEGAPAFPRGRSAPSYAVTGGQADDRSTFVRVTSPKSWYARWAQKCLGVSAGHGASVAARLLGVLAQRDVLTQTPTAKGARAYGIPPSKVVVTPLTDEVISTRTTLLVCETCRSPLPVSPVIAEELEDGPCPSVECRGTLRSSLRETESFYRRLYETADMRRVDAHEHTSLLPPAERREVEAGFKRADQRPGDPNVLVATPTLEMGIDIGDLTTVMLSSLPDSVAKYLQRVGRAGRLTGSSLALAYVTGRGEQLPRLGDPTSMINGEVRPPATYLDAEEILRRQFLASVIDGMMRDGYDHGQRTSGQVLASAEPGTLLGDVIDRVRARGERLLDRFIQTFDNPGTMGLQALRRWALPDRGDDMPTVDAGLEERIPEAVRGVDTLEATIYRAVQEHNRDVEEITRQRREIESALPGLREAAEHQAATDDDKVAFRSANGALGLLRRVLKDLTDEPWITGLEIRGLLPNYSLLDDSVELDAQVSWVNPETQQYETDPLVVDRGSARALTELAPGAYFYARGLEMRVDGVEIGREDAEVRLHAACDTCGYVCDLGPGGGALAAPRVCPRCGSTGIADTGQRFEAVRLKRVFSDIRRDDARIGDDSDERRRTPFEVVTAVDFDPDLCEGRWSVERVGLGVAHYRRLPVRWWNLGRVTGSPAIGRIAGRDVTAQLFRLCEACGKLDKDAGTSTVGEHRAWCRHRNDHQEHTRLLALGRELVTQGVAISLPLAVTEGLYSPPGLAAALLLGLHRTMGGAPDHLRVEIVPHPVGDGGQVVESLLLHDTVPGGTGYLTDLASPERLWGILVRAAQVLETCPCQDEARASCYRCLLPFVRHADQAHRVEALRALKYLLQVEQQDSVADLEVDQPRWSVVHGAVNLSAQESPLEQKFRLALKDRLSGVASVRERPGPRGIELIITGADHRPWTLSPQVDVAGTRPDFLLRTPGLPPIAIYADGRAFHATPAHNAIADDAQKREALRDSGYRVVAVTAADLDEASSPGWLNEVLIGQMMALPAGVLGAGVSRAAAAEHKGGPLALLQGVVESPSDTSRVRLANAAPLLLGLYTGRGGRSTIAPGQSLASVTLGMLTGEVLDAEGEDDLLTYRIPHLAFAARLRGNQPVEMALVVDDSEDAIGDADHEEAWREWLRLSNLLGQSDVPCTITSRTHLQARVLSGHESRRGPDVWEGAVLDDLDDDVVRLARELSASGVAAPEIGAELDGGVAAELSWAESKVAVVYAQMAEDDVHLLRAAGWVVHRAQDDAQTLADEVRGSLSNRDEE